MATEHLTLVAQINSLVWPRLVSVRIAFSIARVILEAIHVPDEIWGRD